MEGSAFGRLVRCRRWNTTQENGRTADGEMLNRTGTDIAVLDWGYKIIAHRPQLNLMAMITSRLQRDSQASTRSRPSTHGLHLPKRDRQDSIPATVPGGESFGGCEGRRQTPARGGSGSGGAVTATRPAAEEGETDTLVGLVGCSCEVSEELLLTLVES
uniref:Uncharacterized protein 2A n=1 Tax=Sorghum bicolor TaxID=4558 RepID=Q84YF9_SORBI|nr:hypothetical protein [Sorghum bicolor]